MRLHLIFIVFLFFIGGHPGKSQEVYSLRKALRTARVNNPVLKAEQFNIRIAQADIVTAHLRPNFELTNESLQLMNPSHFEDNTRWYSGYNRETFWQLSKPLQVAGLRKHKIETARRNVRLAEKEYSENERNLFLDVAGKWLEVWAAQKQMDILLYAKNNIDSLLQIDQRRFQSQVITQTDLYRTELLARQYELQHRTALQEIDNRQKELRFLLGGTGEVVVDTSDQFLLDIPETLDSLIRQSLQYRSDIEAAKSMIEVSESEMKLQKSLSYPQPELGLVWNPQGTLPFFGISFTVDLPVFDRNQGEIQKSAMLRDQAEYYLYAVQKQIETEISVAFSSYQYHQENIEEYQSLLQQSQMILDNVRRTYLMGGTTIIDFLEAQRSWLEIQQQYYEAMEQYRISYIELLYASGLINQLAL